MRDDLKAAVRSLRSSKTFTTVALTVLALGIGASTAIFSVVDAVVLRALPFDEHDRLLAVGERRPAGRAPNPTADPDAVSSSAPQNYMDWAAQQQVFESIAAIAGGAFTLHEPGIEPEDLRVQRVTASFFDVLRVRPSIGRAFTTEHEEDGTHQVAVLSHGLWRRRFGGDPQLLGRTIPLEGAAYQVLGIMPPEFEYPVGAVRSTDLWVPYVVPQTERIRNPNTRSVYLQSIGRLKPGVSREQAQAEMDRIAAALQSEHPIWNKDTLAGVRPLRDHLVGARTKSWMLMLLGAVTIVLLIACANVANLLLARASVREREVGIRAALGAGRWRLMRQFLVESLLLSTLATIVAVVFAWWAIHLLKTSMPEGIPRVAAIALNVRVLFAAAGVALATALLFGTVPALQLSKPQLSDALREGARGASTSASRRHLRSALVIAEVALAVVLLVGASLFIGSFVALMRIDPGFDPERVLTVTIAPRGEPGRLPPDQAVAFTQIVERVAQLPGVRHASMIGGGMPLGGSRSVTSIAVPGGPPVEGDDGIDIRQVTPDYHRALTIPLRVGRLLEVGDRKDAPPVVVINDAAVKKYFGAGNPVGRIVKIDDADRTVVGVVGDVRQGSLEVEPRTEAYVPMVQMHSWRGELIVKTTGDPYAVLPGVKAAVLGVLPDVPLRNVVTMEELIARRVAQRRLNMLLLGLFGLLGLAISAVGLYGVMAYLVSQRTREIGVRMALGATRMRVVQMVLWHAGILVVAGLAIGTGVAWWVRSAADLFLFRVASDNLMAFAAAVGTLAVAALLASVVPARRAASVSPSVALRSE